jgi:nucleoside-diphosphate-sugar epimerase
VLRPTNVFGREQSRADAEVGRSHVIPELLARIDDGPEDSPLEVLGDGSQLRNFVHVSDIAAFLARNLEGRGRRWLNLRSDCTLAIGRLADELCRIRGRRRPLRYRPEFQHHELFTIKNFDLAPPAAAGWTPRIHDISRGLAV